MPRRSTDISRDAYDAAIAAEVRAALARERIQQKEMAEAFGWDRNYLGKRITGQVPFGIPDLTKVCDFLEIDMGELLHRAKQAALNATETTTESGSRAAG